MRTTYKPEQKIVVLVDENPKRKGTEARKRFNKYSRVNTVEDALRLGVRHSDLRWDTAHGFIAIKGRK